jgi:hypothetical protein
MFEPGSGIEPDPFDPSRVGYYSDAYSTFDYPDGTWTVSAELDGGGSPIQAAFQMVNLTVTGTEAHRSSGGTGLVELDELWVAIPEDMMVGWEVDLADGQEPAANPFLVDVDFSLGTLGTGSSGSGANDGSAPGTVTGLILNPGTVPVGFYYKAAHAVERRSAGAPPTGDEAHNLSSHWHLTNATVTGYEYKGARHARITVEADLDTAAMPSQESYAWCRPLPDSGEAYPSNLLTAPPVSTTIVLGDVTSVFGGTFGLYLNPAGSHHLAVAFRDTRTYHQPGLGRWTTPAVVTLEVPATTCYAETEWGSLGTDIYGDLAEVDPLEGTTGPVTFYSDPSVSSTRGGPVDESSSYDEYFEALDEDHVLYSGSHGYEEGGGLCVGNGPDVLEADILQDPASYDQLRLAYISACGSAKDPDGLGSKKSICQRIKDKGAWVVVGWDGCPSSGAAGVLFDKKFMEFLCDGETIADARRDAEAAVELEYGSQPWMGNFTVLGDAASNPITPAFNFTN